MTCHEISGSAIAPMAKLAATFRIAVLCGVLSLACAGTALAARGGVKACAADLEACDASLANAERCGNGVVDAGEDCDQSNLDGETCVTRGFAAGLLRCGAGCAFDTGGCAATRFVDNGDGTVSDLQLGLRWEKKENFDGVSDLSNPHDADNGYSWSATLPFTAPSGTVFTDFLGKLNNCIVENFDEQTGGFAGYCDWRLPTLEELVSLVDPTAPGCMVGGSTEETGEPFPPCIDPVFGPTATESESVSGFNQYLTIVTGQFLADTVACVNFSQVSANAMHPASRSDQHKGNEFRARAVRGGAS